jgi:16S rRNA processing protein RimM
VAAEILTDFPERLTCLREAFLWDGTHEPRRVAIRRCWLSPSRGGQAIFHFEGCDSIPDAEQLVGLEVQIPLEDRMALPKGQYYVSDLIGCAVFAQEADKAKEAEEAKEKSASSFPSASSASCLGVVRAVDPTAGTPLLVVDTPRGELLIPLAEEICRVIDVAARRIEVLLPEGLRELNPS